MPTLTIYDTILTPRPVAIPDACPECGASFLSGSNLLEWDRAEVQFHGNLVADEYQVQDEGDRGDNFDPIAYYCAACRHCLAEGDLTTIEPPTEPIPSDAALAQTLAPEANGAPDT